MPIRACKNCCYGSTLWDTIAAEDADCAKKLKKPWAALRVWQKRASSLTMWMSLSNIMSADRYPGNWSDVNIIMTVNRKTKGSLLTTTPDAYAVYRLRWWQQLSISWPMRIYLVDHSFENLMIKLNYYVLRPMSFLKLIGPSGGSIKMTKNSRVFMQIPFPPVGNSFEFRASPRFVRRFLKVATMTVGTKSHCATVLTLTVQWDYRNLQDSSKPCSCRLRTLINTQLGNRSLRAKRLLVKDEMTCRLMPCSVVLWVDGPRLRNQEGKALISTFAHRLWCGWWTKDKRSTRAFIGRKHRQGVSPPLSSQLPKRFLKIFKIVKKIAAE